MIIKSTDSVQRKQIPNNIFLLRYVKKKKKKAALLIDWFFHEREVLLLIIFLVEYIVQILLTQFSIIVSGSITRCAGTWRKDSYVIYVHQTSMTTIGSKTPQCLGVIQTRLLMQVAVFRARVPSDVFHYEKDLSARKTDISSSTCLFSFSS